MADKKATKKNDKNSIKEEEVLATNSTEETMSNNLADDNSINEDGKKVVDLENSFEVSNVEATQNADSTPVADVGESSAIEIPPVAEVGEPPVIEVPPMGEASDNPVIDGSFNENFEQGSIPQEAIDVDINLPNQETEQYIDPNVEGCDEQSFYQEQYQEFYDMPEETPQEPESNAKGSKKQKKVGKKVDVPKNMKAIKRARRNKIIGKVLASVFVFLFIGSIVGITAMTYTAADKIWWESVGEEADVQFKELFTLFNGVTDSNEDKIVTNGYTQDDLDGFYSNLKRKMFLAQDYDLTISKIMEAVMSSMGSEEQGGETQLGYTTIGVDGYDLQYVYLDSNGNTVISDEIPTLDEDEVIDDNTTSDDEITDGGNGSLTGNEMLDELLKELKFDFSSLEDYKGEKNILEISDKQLGAVINDAFTAISSGFEQLKELEETIGKPINEVLAVKQVVIDGDELNNADVNLKITLELKAKDLLSNLLTQYNIPSIVNKILPEKLYASVRVYPYDSTKPVEASINRLEETKVNKIVRIIDVILGKTGNTTSVSDLLIQVNSKVVEVFGQAQEKLPIALVPTGSLDLYPIETMMSMLEVEVSEQAFLYMLKDVKLPTGESLNLIMPTESEKRMYTGTFISELGAKYCLDNSDGKISETNTIKDVMDFASSEDALEAIHLKEMDYSSTYSQQLKVRTSYEALASMLSDYIKNEGLLGEFDADIVKMSYKSSTQILSIDIRINLAEMLGFNEEDVMSSLILQLVPQYIYVSANICVNADKDVPTTIEINKVGEERSQEHLQTLTALAGKFGMDVSSLSYEGVCGQIDEAIKQGISQMQEQIGCEILFSNECAYLPNLFELVCATGLLDEDEENKLEPENLYSIMKQVYTFSVSSEERNKSQNANGFIGELEGKYYLQQGVIVDDGEGGLFDSVMELKDNIGTSIDKSALANDNRGMNEIYPRMTAGEFAYLMELNIGMDDISDTIKSANMLGAKISDREVVLYLQARLYDTQNDNQSVDTTDEDDLSKYSNLIPQDAYISLFVDTANIKADSQEKAVKVIFDGMDEDEMSDFFSIVRKLTGKDTTQVEIEDNVDTQIKSSIGDIEGIEFKFTDGALLFDNIFNVIADSDMVKSDNPNDYVFKSEEIRRLLKSLYGFDYQAIGGNFTPSTNLDNFIDVELYNKYFISDSFKERLKEYEQQDAILDGFAHIGGEEFTVDNIRLQDIVRENSPTVYGLTSRHNMTDTSGKSQSQIDEEITQNFKPKFSSEELAYLLRTQVSATGDIAFLKNQEVVYVNNDDNYMTLTLRGNGNFDDEQAQGLMPDEFYININIDLGVVLTNGTRSDMNVESMDINSIEYADNGGDNQDLQLLLMLVDRIQSNTQSSSEPSDEISLDNIMQDIEEKLNEFKDKIHNDIFTVTFLEDGGLMFNQTVYQIALNSLYDVDAYDVTSQAQMPNEIDFRNGLCKVNNMPDKIEYSQNVYLDLLNGNRAENSNNAIAEINEKYALSNPLQDGALAILTILGNYAKDYATSIDGEKLTSDQNRARTVEEMQPMIEGEELLLMLEDSVTFSAEGYENAKLNALYIRDNEMIIVYKSSIKLDGEDDKYNELLPAQTSIIVNIDVNNIDKQDVICTRISVNDLSSEELDAIQSMMMRINQKDGVESKSLEEANEECSDNVRSTMKSLTDNMAIRYVADPTVDEVTGGGLMVLDSIYEVAAQKINLSDSAEEPLEAIDVKLTLEALFNGLNISAYTPPSNYNGDMSITYTTSSSNMTSTNLYLDTTQVMTGKFNVNGAIGGWNIASMIDTQSLLEPLGFDKDAPNSSEILKLKHTALVPKRANGDGTFDEIRAALGSLLDNEYFLITLDMDMVSAAGVEMSILPKRMDLTLYMDLTSENISIIYNAMSDDQRKILSRLVKTSRPEGVSGLDLSNTDAVKSEIMGMEIIKESYGGYTLSITLEDLLSSGGKVVPVSKLQDCADNGEYVMRDENVVLGLGAMIINYEAQL